MKTVMNMTCIEGAYRLLMAAVIARAMLDLQVCYETSMKRKDETMSWFYGQDFEAFCAGLEMDPEPIREKAAELYSQNIPDLLMPKPLRVVSAETRAKISAAHKGRPKSPEHREKLRLAKLGTKQAPETIEKRAAALSGRRRPPEIIERLRLTNIGRKHTEASKEKMRVAQRARFNNPGEREKARQRTLKRFSDPEERRKQSARTRAYHAKHKPA